MNGRPRRQRRRNLRSAWLAAAALMLVPTLATAQHLPFAVGEELNYRLRVGGVGTVGTGTMRVEGPEDVRGTRTLVLRSEIQSTLRLVSGSDRSASWLDPVGMRSLRFEKRERSPFTRRDDSIDLFSATREWRAADGSMGRSGTDAPLDELSFIYFIRTLPLVPGASFSFDRHYDPARNPVSVRVTGREQIRVGAGEFTAFVVEMRVKDPERYRGTGLIRIHISDGPARLPLQIESAVPRMGTTVLSLESHNRTVPPQPQPATGR